MSEMTVLVTRIKSVEKYKDEIENLTQIEIEDYDKKIEEIEESKIKSNK